MRSGQEFPSLDVCYMDSFDSDYSFIFSVWSFYSYKFLVLLDALDFSHSDGGGSMFF